MGLGLWYLGSSMDTRARDGARAVVPGIILGN